MASTIRELPAIPRPIKSLAPSRIVPLDVASDATFERWLALPPHDGRTIEEYSADGGRPVAVLNFDMGRGPHSIGVTLTGAIVDDLYYSVVNFSGTESTGAR